MGRPAAAAAPHRHSTGHPAAAACIGQEGTKARRPATTFVAVCTTSADATSKHGAEKTDCFAAQTQECACACLITMRHTVHASRHFGGMHFVHDVVVHPNSHLASPRLKSSPRRSERRSRRQRSARRRRKRKRGRRGSGIHLRQTASLPPLSPSPPTAAADMHRSAMAHLASATAAAAGQSTPTSTPTATRP